MGVYVPGTTETDPKKQNRSLQQLGAATEGVQSDVASAQTDITALQTTVGGLPSTFVSSFKTRTGAVTPAQGDYTSDLIPGTTTNSSATAGNIGEEKTTSLVIGNFTTTSVAQNVTSLVLPAGDWDLSGFNLFSGAGSTFSQDGFTVITTAATPSVSNTGSPYGATWHNRYPSGQDYAYAHTLPPIRVSIATSTTYYMHSEGVFSGGVFSFAGLMRARRVR